MKKKILSFLLTVVMLFSALALPTVASEYVVVDVPYYTQTFDDFTTDMTADAIKAKLGWTGWDLSVAALKIVEVGGDKKLQIVPLRANENTSATLTSEIDRPLVYLDMEITPVKADTLDVEKTTTSADDPSSLSFKSGINMSLAFPITGESGVNKVVQGLHITGRQNKQVYTNGELTYNNQNSWNTWYNNRIAKPYGTLAVNSNPRFYIDNSSDRNYLFGEHNADGLVFGYRMQFTMNNDAKSFESYVACLDEARLAENKTSDYLKTTVTKNVEDVDMVGAVNSFYNDQNFTGKCIAAIEYTAGLSVYLDDIRVYTQTGSGSVANITVNGEAQVKFVGEPIGVATLVENADDLLCAVVTDAGGNKTVYGVKDSITVADGMNIQTYSLAMETTEIEMRTNAPMGIRWETTLSKETVEDINELIQAGIITNIGMGTLIAPTHYVTAAGAMTTEKLDNLDVLRKYLTAVGEWDTWYTTTDTDCVFAGSLANIKEDNYTMDFTGVGFINIAFSNGQTVKVYASYTEAMSNDVSTLAQSVIDDANNGLDAETLEAVRGFIVANAQ